MAQHRYRQGPWPPKTDDQPDGWFRNPGFYARSERPLAGALRVGTMPGVGPKGAASVAENTRGSDMGMDRIDPYNNWDPMGTTLRRAGEIPSSLIAPKVRGRRGED